LGFSLVFLARTPPLDSILPDESYILYIGMSLLCAAFAGIIPIVTYINEKICALGMDSEKYAGVINILFNNTWRFGEIVGPLLASIFMEFMSFPYVCGGGGLVVIAWTIFWVTVASQLHASALDEKQPLLGEDPISKAAEQISVMNNGNGEKV